jgi:hypothetical protein
VVTVRKNAIIKRDCFKRKASEARKAQKNKNSPKDSTKVPTKVNSLYAALHSKQWDSSGTWCIDLGATHHMSNSDRNEQVRRPQTAKYVYSGFGQPFECSRKR